MTADAFLCHMPGGFSPAAGIVHDWHRRGLTPMLPPYPGSPGIASGRHKKSRGTHQASDAVSSRLPLRPVPFVDSVDVVTRPDTGSDRSRDEYAVL